jgi:hypothetical protein
MSGCGTAGFSARQGADGENRGKQMRWIGMREGGKEIYRLVLHINPLGP